MSVVRRWCGLLVALSVLVACSGTHPVGTVLMRNESATTAMIRLATPAEGSQPAVTQSLALEPWHAGLCPYATRVLMALPVTITVTAGASAAPVVRQANPSGVDVVFVTVGASGSVSVRAGPEPVQAASCAESGRG